MQAYNPSRSTPLRARSKSQVMRRFLTQLVCLSRSSCVKAPPIGVPPTSMTHAAQPPSLSCAYRSPLLWLSAPEILRIWLVKIQVAIMPRMFPKREENNIKRRAFSWVPCKPLLLQSGGQRLIRATFKRVHAAQESFEPVPTRFGSMPLLCKTPRWPFPSWWMSSTTLMKTARRRLLLANTNPTPDLSKSQKLLTTFLSKEESKLICLPPTRPRTRSEAVDGPLCPPQKGWPNPVWIWEIKQNYNDSIQLRSLNRYLPPPLIIII